MARSPLLLHILQRPACSPAADVAAVVLLDLLPLLLLLHDVRVDALTPGLPLAQVLRGRDKGLASLTCHHLGEVN